MNTIHDSENAVRHSADIRSTKIPLNHGTGAIPALGFGTLYSDLAETRNATTAALRAGFRCFDCAERYKNEREIGESLRAELAAGTVAREDLFMMTKLWNTNHRPERVPRPVLFAVAAIVLILLAIWVIRSFRTVSTDDAYVNSYVTFVAPRVGTGSTLALLPAQNATGNFVKVVQRLPVRIDLVNYDPDNGPLFVGLSVEPEVDIVSEPTGPNAGKFLQDYLSNVPTAQP